MVAAANPKRQNGNEPSKDSDDIEVSVEPFNPATSMKKRKTGDANLVKSAFEDTLNNFAEADKQSSTCELHCRLRFFFTMMQGLINVLLRYSGEFGKSMGTTSSTEA
jgi:hypothetical protein